MVNEIANSFLHRDYERVEELIGQLEAELDCTVKRNQQYLDFMKARLKYCKGLMSETEYEAIAKSNVTYGTMNFDGMIAKVSKVGGRAAGEGIANGIIGR